MVATTIIAPVTKFSESNALSIKRKIIPKDIDDDKKIFFKKILMVKLIAKKNGVKNPKICKILVWVRFSG